MMLVREMLTPRILRSPSCLHSFAHCACAICFFFLLCFVTSAVYSQKTYDAIYYSGKADKYSFKLLYAFGYISGSEITVMDTWTKKKFTATITTSALDTSVIFKHTNAKGVKLGDYVRLLSKIDEGAEMPPVRIMACYFLKNKRYIFFLSKVVFKKN